MRDGSFLASSESRVLLLFAIHCQLIYKPIMGRTVKFFYWISGDPPSDSYELKFHAEDGETMPTASEFQQTMAASNARLAGAYLRMWKVGSI